MLGIDLLGNSGDGEPTAAPGAARVLSGSELSSQELEAYWLGPRAGTRYELRTEEGGAVFVRYLTAGAEAGASRGDYLTVATYPVPNASEALNRASEEGGGAIVDRGDHEVLAGQGETSAYLVFDDDPDLQVEIFSPAPGEARALALSGDAAPLDEEPSNE